MTERLEKLRRLITHDGTPEAERSAALKRLEAMIGHGTSPDAPPGGYVTRSVRIGHRRRPIALDEFSRLEHYTPDATYGDVVRDIHLACQASSAIPSGVDFGFHQTDEAVVALRFRAGMMGNPMDLQEELRHFWPNARVNLSQQDLGEEKILLVYLGVHQRRPEPVDEDVR
ncbi:MAG: hypothetical protein R3C97_08160 [Geminicoccaceae bacterium]